MSEQHARAVANIKFALANKDSFVIITGEIGVGKTTILNSVLATLDNTIVMARITHTSLSPTELLQAVLLTFDLPIENDSKVLLFDRIRQFLLEQYAKGKHVVIAVDEAQNLGSLALEELRLLTCIEADTKELLTVVLMGQPALSDLINSEALHNLRQRTRLRQHLWRLNFDETIEYLRHRLSVAGGDYEKIFEHDAAQLIHDVTLGTPRLINTLCDTAMTAVALRETGSVTAECVHEVLEELGWKESSAAPPNDAVKIPASSNLPTLAVYRDGQLMDQVTVVHPLFAIGRGPSNHLQLDHRGTGRRHALISFENGRYYIEDFDSRNRTYHNGKRCGVRPVALISGDQIEIGVYELVYREASSTTHVTDQNDESDDSSVRKLTLPNIHAGTT
jgi:type II secretory pathway predicted ATPase ExeA